MKQQAKLGLASPFKRGRAPSSGRRILEIEVGDVIRIGDEDYRVQRLIRDGRFVVRRVRGAEAESHGGDEQGEEDAA